MSLTASAVSVAAIKAAAQAPWSQVPLSLSFNFIRPASTSAMTTTNIFFVGGTGYCGAPILDQLLQRAEAEKLKLRVLARSVIKAEKLKSIGVDIVFGSLSHLKTLEEEAAKSDIVISAASSDDLSSTRAIIAGLKRRKQETGNAPSVIHLSGVAVLSDDAMGKRSDKVWSDDADSIAKLPPSAPHRLIDLEFEKADTEGFIKSHIILPAYVFGTAENRLTKLGVAPPRNVYLPSWASIGVLRGAAWYFGEGQNIAAAVDVNEVADVTRLVFDEVLAASGKAGHGREGYYFASSSEYSWKEFQDSVGEALFELGKVRSPKATSLSDHEIDALFGRRGATILGGNLRCESQRALALGWKPWTTSDDLYKSVKETVIKAKDQLP